MDDSYLLTRREIERKLGIRRHRSTWIRWEKTGQFPRGTRIGAFVHYPWHLVRAWLIDHGLYAGDKRPTL